MGTYELNKISLSRFVDKRFALNDGIHALAYFHKDLKKWQYSIMRLSRQFQACLFFLQKDFACTKTRHKQKSTIKTKIS